MNLYTKNELFCSNTQKIYDNKAEEARFYLGGIGTGNFCVGSRGQLANWQLFNQPGFDNILPYTFFAIRTSFRSIIKNNHPNLSHWNHKIKCHPKMFFPRFGILMINR